jgi:hypothetical protein
MQEKNFFFFFFFSGAMLVFRCIVYVLFFAVHVARSSNDIGYQLHSYDDLDQWDAYLLPNWPGATPRAQFMKVDVQYVPQSVCMSLVHPPVTGCVNGTIALAHNPVTEALFLRYFYGDDLIDYFRTRRTLGPLGLALCGKAPLGLDPCSDSDAHYGPAFRATMDSFMSRLIAAANTNVEFIIDGSLVPSQGEMCMLNRWGTWNSTWQGTPKSALVENLSKLDANYQIFNIPVLVPELFWFYSKINYGKFSQQTHYPYLVWEPSEQPSILQVSKYYRNGQQHVPQGLRFAINISPERFLVYGAQYNKQAWNERLVDTANFSSPHAFALTAEGLIVMFAWNSADASIVAWIANYSSWFGSIGQASAQHVQLFQAKDLASVQRVSAAEFVACDVSANCVQAAVNASQRSITISGQQKLQIAQGSTFFWGGKINHQLVALTGSTTCPLLLGSSCIVQAGSSAVVSASVALDQSGSPLIAFADATNSVFLFNQNVIKRIGVGSTASVDASSDMICVTASDSFCWNTEPNNKDIVRVCSMQPSSTRGVLSYWCGRQGDWANITSAVGVTACHPTIRSGSFDQGSDSRVSLVSDRGTLRLVEAHLGATKDDQFIACGVAVEYDGIVIDSFPL